MTTRHQASCIVEQIEAVLLRGPLMATDIQARLPGVSEQTAKYYIGLMRRAGKLHVSGWRKHHHHHAWCAVYGSGPGEDAPRPSAPFPPMARGNGRSKGKPIHRVLTLDEASMRAATAPPLMRLGGA